MLRDFSFATRTLRKNPAFTLTAILTIALGVGASTAIFSVVNGVLLRPLPYAHADHLAFIWNDLRARKVYDFPMPPGDMPDLKQQVTSFGSIAAVSSGRANFVGNDGKPEQITLAGVTPNFFTVLGTHIAFGRNFVADDEIAPPPAPRGQPADPNAPPPTRLLNITILSHAYWQKRFGSDSAVIGKTVQV